jgi:hypothetical protein
MAIVETWFLTQLKDKKGNPINREAKNGGNLFAWFMCEIVIGYYGGLLGSKHRTLHRFYETFQPEGIFHSI